jgi:hypothetical protein
LLLFQLKQFKDQESNSDLFREETESQQRALAAQDTQRRQVSVLSLVVERRTSSSPLCRPSPVYFPLISEMVIFYHVQINSRLSHEHNNFFVSLCRLRELNEARARWFFYLNGFLCIN